MIESRRRRLREATRFLRDNDHNGTLLRAFEGQYFVEAEFLLFNHADAGAAISAVLDDWRAAFTPKAARRCVVACYFAVVLATRDRLYLALRVARRVVMRLLPDEFFPTGGRYNAAPAPGPIVARIRNAMPYQPAAAG